MIRIVKCERCGEKIGCYAESGGVNECETCGSSGIKTECYAMLNPHRTKKLSGICNDCLKYLADDC